MPDDAQRTVGAETEAALRELAAVTDADLAAAVRAGVAAVFAAVTAWQASPAWREDNVGQRIRRIVEQTQAQLAALPDREDLRGAVRAAGPVLGAWWPRSPAPHAPAVVDAVERQRAAAMHRPIGVRQARDIVAGYDRDRGRGR